MENIIEEALEDVKHEDIKEVEDIPESGDAKEVSTPVQPKDDYLIDQIARDLNIANRESSVHGRDLELLLSYAKAKGAKDTDDILWEIRKLQMQVGKGGGNYIKKMSRYAYLYTEKTDIEKELMRYGQ